MKQVYTTKDTYQDNSVRVNYFHKDAIRIHKKPELNDKTKQVTLKELEETYDELLFCERLFWETHETELDVSIENIRISWEERINS
jgi:hypothetical protein